MPLDPPANTREPREAHKIDPATLARHLGVPADTLVARQFKGGQSNPTYWVGAGDDAYVLRKKPPGKLLPSAHAVEREYRVMRALAGTDVPVPDVVSLCEDESVIGTPFFVMRYVPGRIFWDPTVPEVDNAARTEIYAEYIRVLAALHKVDFGAVGLGDYGKIGGYVPRQFERWSKQYESSKTADIPPMNALMSWLATKTPATDETTLIHGDYRIDNLMYSTSSPLKTIAVLDWELSTLGHPVSDLAYACMGYHLNLPGRGGLAGVDAKSLGIPDERGMVDEYCRLTGRGTIADWPYFMAFGIFRLAAIAQGVYKRSLQGNASSDDASGYGAAVTMLSELACSIAGIKTS